MLEKNQKVIVKSDHKFHAGRVGYFRFYGGPEDGYDIDEHGYPIEKIIVLSSEPHDSENESMTIFCIGQGDYKFPDDEKHEFESDEKCVHTEHCCAKCGCKYSDDCPVWEGYKKQSYPCEYCMSENIVIIAHSEFMNRRKARND